MRKLLITSIILLFGLNLMAQGYIHMDLGSLKKRFAIVSFDGKYALGMQPEAINSIYEAPEIIFIKKGEEPVKEGEILKQRTFNIGVDEVSKTFGVWTDDKNKQMFGNAMQDNVWQIIPAKDAEGYVYIKNTSITSANAYLALNGADFKLTTANKNEAKWKIIRIN
ncbi:MAG: hypothetical protein P1P88_24190 [Bacteroidales bacterium]|nr:hypothetical protein [Bacteroidales bacterium]